MAFLVDFKIFNCFSREKEKGKGREKIEKAGKKKRLTSVYERPYNNLTKAQSQ